MQTTTQHKSVQSHLSNLLEKMFSSSGQKSLDDVYGLSGINHDSMKKIF